MSFENVFDSSLVDYSKDFNDKDEKEYVHNVLLNNVYERFLSVIEFTAETNSDAFTGSINISDLAYDVNDYVKKIVEDVLSDINKAKHYYDSAIDIEYDTTWSGGYSDWEHDATLFNKVLGINVPIHEDGDISSEDFKIIDEYYYNLWHNEISKYPRKKLEKDMFKQYLSDIITELQDRLQDRLKR